MNEKLNKMIKKDRIMLMIGVACLLVIAGCIYWIHDASKKEVPQIMTVEKEDKGAYLNTVIEPYGFAARNGQKEWLAIVADENHYLYIIQLTNTQFNELENYFATADEDAIYRIQGQTRQIDANIASLALDAYNDEIEDEDKKIAEEDFNMYFGYFYLEMGETVDTSLPIAIITISSILALSFIFTGLIATSRTKKTVNSEAYQKAIEELNSPENETKNAILTKNYIVYNNCGLNIVDYKDVTWVYRHTYRYNGVPNHSLAYYIRGSKKMNLISYGLNQKAVDELVLYISKKNPNVLVGYTKENIKAHKENI